MEEMILPGGHVLVIIVKRSLFDFLWLYAFQNMGECVWFTHLLLFCRYFAVNRGGREGIDDVSVHLFLIVPVSGSAPSVSVCAILLLV